MLDLVFTWTLLIYMNLPHIYEQLSVKIKLIKTSVVYDRKNYNFNVYNIAGHMTVPQSPSGNSQGGHTFLDGFTWLILFWFKYFLKCIWFYNFFLVYSRKEKVYIRISIWGGKHHLSFLFVRIVIVTWSVRRRLKWEVYKTASKRLSHGLGSVANNLGSNHLIQVGTDTHTQSIANAFE